jgi:hypothetical protein
MLKRKSPKPTKNAPKLKPLKLTLDAVGDEKLVKVVIEGRQTIGTSLKVGFGQPSLSEQVSNFFAKHKLSLEHVRLIEVGPPGKYFTITRQVAVVANALAWLRGVALYERDTAGSRRRVKGFLRPSYSHAPNITKSKKT